MLVPTKYSIQKKTREMRGPRKRRKNKGDSSSVGTSVASVGTSNAQFQFGDPDDDDEMSYLSLEYNDMENDNSSYGTTDHATCHSKHNATSQPTKNRYSNSNKMKTPERRAPHYINYQSYESNNSGNGRSGLGNDSMALVEDWSAWFDNVVDQFGRPNSPENQSLSYLYSNSRAVRHQRSPSETSLDSHGQWLELQQEWSISKQPLSEKDDLEAEEIERKKWGVWAMHASEKERQRRIAALAEIDAEQERERLARGKWALEAIERERSERISGHFLSSLASTNWFNEAISAYSEDYELVCPYYRMGCKVSCRRSTLQKHLTDECIFAQQIKQMDMASNKTNHDDGNFQPDNYEIICPNAFMGCTFTCSRKNLHDHLLSCSYNGISKEKDLEERQLTKQAVILECEEERIRRLRHLVHGSGYWSEDSNDLEESVSDSPNRKKGNTNPNSNPYSNSSLKFNYHPYSRSNSADTSSDPNPSPSPNRNSCPNRQP
jgi:hypothetical protein